ncbi:MAG: ferredoxin [Firmicutes bacterium HGW-Firmicutes-8]|nr:MAG: ferredoxin [Firmicutes bacterium HGW-Firmicutes-8]
MIIRGEQAEESALMRAAELMCAAARTAPKGRGVDNIESLIVTDEELKSLAAEMRTWAEKTGAGFCARDAGNLDLVKVAVILGTTVQPLGLPGCGYCGFGDCEGMQKAGGVCAFNTGDLGIAVGSAVSTASALRVDNRIMFSIGRAAINLKMFNTDVKVAYGIPLSISGKNPFFDRLAK